MSDTDDLTITRLCDELTSTMINEITHDDLEGARNALVTTLERYQDDLDALLRGPKAFYFRRESRERLYKVARAIAGIEGEIPPSDQHTFDLWVTSTYALCANWVLGGCHTTRETFLCHLTELDERLLGV